MDDGGSPGNLRKYLVKQFNRRGIYVCIYDQNAFQKGLAHGQPAALPGICPFLCCPADWALNARAFFR